MARKEDDSSGFSPELSENSLLSSDRIIERLKDGTIVIDPFSKENLGTVSYDVTLGEHYFREQNRGPLKKFYSPYSQTDVKEVWGKPQLAENALKIFGEEELPIPEGIREDDRVILISPGETILAHTQEFIGGRHDVTTMMKARSSLGRNFIEVCKCAGWGDLGYINRWTMEITNNSVHYAIPLVVGRRIAQIAFFQVDPVTRVDYSGSGKYQTDQDLDRLKQSWLPHMMLPQMWKDREVQNGD